MSFLKRLFGIGGGGEGASDDVAAREDYQGYSIAAAPISEGGQFRLAGTISKPKGEEIREHTFIRADLFPSRDEAVEATLRKAKRVIDEQGETIFR